MDSHVNADSRGHLLPAKFLGWIAKLRFVAHRSNVLAVSVYLGAPSDVEWLSGSNLFIHIEGANFNSTRTCLPGSPRLISCTPPHSLNPVPMPRRISNYSSLDNAKINNAGCAQAECFIDLTKRRDPQKLKTLNQLRRLLKEQQLLQATKEAKGRFQSSHERGGHVLPRDRGQQPNELSHHQPISGYEWDELK